jgi:competence protein ComEA
MEKKMKFLALIVMVSGLLFASVDINNATAKELTSIKGIGTKKAEAIIKYRKGHCFKSVDEITKVKGFGKKFLQKNKKMLKAGKCKK